MQPFFFFVVKDGILYASCNVQYIPHYYLLQIFLFLIDICRSTSLMNKYLEGLIIGILAGVCIIYGFQTRVQYRVWMVKAYDHPWIIYFNISSLKYLQINEKIGAMLLIISIAMIVDGIIFSRNLKI
jgi:hypothetical protein